MEHQRGRSRGIFEWDMRTGAQIAGEAVQPCIYTSKQRLWLATPSGSGSLSGAAPETPVSPEAGKLKMKDGSKRRKQQEKKIKREQKKKTAGEENKRRQGL